MGTAGLNVLVLAAAVAGCAAAPVASGASGGPQQVPEAGAGKREAPATPTGSADTCGAARFAHLVGQGPEAARALGLPQRTRIIGHGDPVTMDYLPDRLNIQLGPDGKIRQISCG
jgi:hypothetical protein